MLDISLINELSLPSPFPATKLQDASCYVHWTVYLHPQIRGKTTEMIRTMGDDQTLSKNKLVQRRQSIN